MRVRSLRREARVGVGSCGDDVAWRAVRMDGWGGVRISGSESSAWRGVATLHATQSRGGVALACAVVPCKPRGVGGVA